MTIPPPPSGFIVDGQGSQQLAPPPPQGFIPDSQGTSTQDATIPTAPQGNLFSPENLQTDVYAQHHWETVGQSVINSPQKAQAEQFAAAHGRPLTPAVAAEYIKSTMSPEAAQKVTDDARVEGRAVQFIDKRDQLGTVAAQQYIQNNPGASDEDIYKYVHQNLLQAGVDSSKLPAFTIDPKTKEVKTDRGLIVGLGARALAAIAAFPTGAAEAGARAIQQGVYQASRPFYGTGPNPYEEALKRQNAGVEQFNQATESALRGSTFGQAHPTYGLVEEGVAQVPSLLLLGGLGKAGQLGKVAEYGQIAGMEFNKAYEKIYNDGLQKGMSVGEASKEATVSGAMDAAVNTYLMKFGLLGAKGGEGLKGRLRAALTSAPAQAGVAGAQEALRQFSSYAVTGSDPQLEQILHAAISGGVTGAVGGFAIGAPHGEAQAKPGAEAPAVPAPSAEQMAAVTAPKTEAPIPSALQPPKAEVTMPKLVETAAPKTRVQQGETSRGVNLEFDNPIDKALFVATETRKGKRSFAARDFLQAKGFAEEAIDVYGDELRTRVDHLSSLHEGEGVLRIPTEGNSGVAEVAAKQPEPVAVSEKPVAGPRAAEPQNAAEQGAQKVASPVGVNNEAPQAVTATRVTEAKAQASTEQLPGGSKVAPSVREAEKSAEETLRKVMPKATLIPHENLSKPHQEVLQLHEELTGQKMHAYTGGRGRAFVHEGTAFYNIDANKTPQERREAVSHEATHWLQKKYPRLVKAVLDAIPAPIAAKLDAEYARAYKSQEGKVLDGNKIEDERSAFFVGKAMARPSVARAVMAENHGAFVRAADTIIAKLRGLTAHGRAINEVVKALQLARGFKQMEEGRARRPLTEALGGKPSFLPSEEDLKNKDYTVMTAENPGAKTLSPEENAKRNQDLEAELKRMGVDYTKVVGRYGGTPENSFVIHDISREDALQLGKKFGQESVLRSKEGLVYQDGSVHPRNGETIVGAKAKETGFYSELPDGTTFQVPIDFENKVPAGSNEKLNTAIKGIGEIAGNGETAPIKVEGKGVEKLTAAIDGIQKIINTPDFLPDYRPTKEENKQAMEDIHRFLDPSEWDSLSNPQVKQAIQIFKDLPSDVEFQQASLAGLAKKGWYQQAATALMQVFGKDTRRFVSLLAGDSPRQSVVNNLRESLRVWLAWEQAGRPTDPNILRPWLDGLLVGVTAEGQPKGLMSTRVPNLVRALSAPEGQLGALSGYKVGSFQENLIGNLWKSTNDTWMAQFGGIDQKLFSDNGGYLGYTAKVRRVAQLMNIAPANVQETVWSFFMTLANRVNKSTTGQQALEQLTHEDIARAPAFADMLRDPQVNELLSRLGISDAIIGRAEEAAFAQRETAPTGPIKRGANPILERVAQRAESVAKNKPGESEFLPSSKFIEEDVKPFIVKAGKAVADAFAGVKSLIAPYSRSPEAGTTRNVLRERGSDLAQRWDRLGAAFEESKTAMDKMPEAVTRDFIDKIEKNQPQTNPALQPIADALRAVLDDRLHQVQALGTGKLADFIEHYFPHLWKDPTAAASLYQQIIAKTPIEGSKKFLRQRTHEFFSDGLAAGLKPVTENPVEAMMLRVREMDKYITAHQAFQEMEGKGLLTEIKARDKVPAGYAKINDNIATVFARPNRRGAIQIQGYKIAPEEVANVINNYLTPGIRSNKHFGGAFRGYLGAANLMNAAQLGLSGFHLAFTTMDSGVSKLALGIEQAARGQWKGAAKSLASTATIVGPAIENFRRGNQVMKEWYTPGSTTPEIASIVQAMKAAGGRAAMDDFYRTDMTDKMMQAFRKGNTLGGIIRSPFAAIEQTAKPILESLVPRIKMGAFMDLAKHNLETNPGMTHDQLRESMRKAWDSVDNRLGEMVYDNLFWNKTVKDLAMASVRSVGWNLGTFRELGGGIKDFANVGKELVTGKGGRLTHRMAYTVAMPVFTGIIGASINYMLTGKKPEELKDYFFPKTGAKDKEGHDVRLALPSYMKDVFAYGQDIKTAVTESKPGALLTTLKHKVHPLLNTVLDMLSNEDYYGTKIRNEDDPAMKQLVDAAKYAGKSLVPFGIRDVASLTEQGQGAKAFLPLTGITKARQDITSTEAELRAREVQKNEAPRGSRTSKQADKARLLNTLAEGMKAKDPAARVQLNTALKAGILTESDVESLKNRVRFRGLERSIHGINDVKAAMGVWDVMTDDEKRRNAVLMLTKVRGSQSLEREVKIEFMRRLQADVKRLREGK